MTFPAPANAKQIIRKGESIPFSFDLKGKPLTGWVCNIFVKSMPSDVTILTRTIAPDGLKYPGFLTSTEVNAMPEGEYRIIGKITKADSDQEKQLPDSFRFTLSGAWA